MEKLKNKSPRFLEPLLTGLDLVKYGKKKKKNLCLALLGVESLPQVLQSITLTTKPVFIWRVYLFTLQHEHHLIDKNGPIAGQEIVIGSIDTRKYR